MTAMFQPADWAIVAFATVAAVTGLFRGFSGTLAFLLACVLAVLGGNFCWLVSVLYLSATWQRAGVVLVTSLFIFGLVRFLVRKLVNGLLAQPADAIFGFLTGLLVGVLIPVVWAWTGMYLEYSFLAEEVAAYVR